MNTITDFLLARIAEDEEQFAVSDEDRAFDWSTYPDLNEAWIHFTSLRLLAECEAKRGFVKMYERSGGCWTAYGESQLCDISEWMIRALASVYADHPDYRAEWRL